jgi:hypothetical protein
MDTITLLEDDHRSVEKLVKRSSASSGSGG